MCLGTIETPMVDRIIAAGELDGNASGAASAIPRPGRADEIADPVLWLCNTGAPTSPVRTTRRRRVGRRLTKSPHRLQYGWHYRDQVVTTSVSVRKTSVVRFIGLARSCLRRGLGYRVVGGSHAA